MLNRDKKKFESYLLMLCRIHWASRQHMLSELNAQCRYQTWLDSESEENKLFIVKCQQTGEYSHVSDDKQALLNKTPTSISRIITLFPFVYSMFFPLGSPLRTSALPLVVLGKLAKHLTAGRTYLKLLKVWHPDSHIIIANFAFQTQSYKFHKQFYITLNYATLK